MGIFDNIVFDEFTLLEGEQAEAYKKRKEEEKKHTDDQGAKRFKAKKAETGYGGSFNDIKDQINRRRYIGDKITGSGRGASIHHHKNDDVEILSDVGNRMTKDNPNDSIFKNKKRKEIRTEDRKRQDKVEDITMKSGKPDEQGYPTKVSKYGSHSNDKYAFEYQKDAVNRHIRRHPKQYKESVFEDIEMI